MEDNTYFEEGAIANGFDFKPESAVVGGEWVILSCTKFWFKTETRVGNTSETGGMTFEYPYGNEIRVALPLVDNPTISAPENTITVEQLKLAMDSAITIVKKEIK